MVFLQSKSGLVTVRLRRVVGFFSLVVGVAAFTILVLSLLSQPMASSSEPHLWPLIKGILILGWFILTFVALVAMAREEREWPDRQGLVFVSYLERVALLCLLLAAAVEWFQWGYLAAPTILPSLKWELTDWLGFILPLLWLNALAWDQLVFLPALTKGPKEVRTA